MLTHSGGPFHYADDRRLASFFPGGWPPFFTEYAVLLKFATDGTAADSADRRCSFALNRASPSIGSGAIGHDIGYDLMGRSVRRYAHRIS